MGKKYFLTDSELENVNGDFFNTNDLKKNIFKIIENNKMPYNIAVIGKWGLGKSSLINMVKSELENKSGYKVIQINAWKYEKEALARVFLRQILLELGEAKDKKTTAEMFNDEIKECLAVRREHQKGNKEEESTIWKLLLEFLKKNVWFILAVCLASVVLYGIYKIVALNLLGIWKWDFGYFAMHFFTGYCRNVGVVLVLPIFLSLMTMAVERIKDMENSVGVAYPTPGVEDYEILLERKMKSHENEKLVVILDDLDRLSAKKMVEALDAIKVFINYNNFIFIVPFDDEILKKSMRDEKVQNEMGVLDKLFQYKLYLPPLYVDNIKDYAANLCKDGLADFIDDYCDGNEYEVDRIVRNILIHSEVETPRQVKKLVNSFVNNHMVGVERERSNKVEKGFASSVDGMRMIAKLSVLQADFKEFYDLLIMYPNAMELVLNANKDRTKIPKLPNDIKEYLKVYKIGEDSSGGWYMDESNTPLINFLSQTAQYEVNAIESYLYMTMDDIAIRAGSKKQQEFLKMVKSGNMTGALDVFKETPEVFEAAPRLLKRTSDIQELKHIVCVLIYMFKEINAEQLSLAIDAINIRAQEFAENMTEADEKEIDFIKLMYGYEASDFSEDYLKIIQTCIESTSKNQVFLKLQAYMDNIKWFKGEVGESILDHIRWILNNNLIKPNDFWILNKKFEGSRKEWAESYYKYLVKHVVENNNRDENMFTELPKAFGLCVTKDNASELWNLMRNVFGVGELAKLFLGMVQADTEKCLTDKDVSAVIDQQIITTDSRDYESINSLILLRDYEPEDVDSYCDYIKLQSDTSVASDLILAYEKEHGADEMQSVILVCVNEVIANPEIKCAGNFEKLIGICGKTTRNEIVKQFVTATKYVATSQHEYAQLQKLYGIFAKKYWNEADTVMSQIFQYVSQNNVYPEYAKLVVDYAMESYESFDDETKDKYLVALIKIANSSNLVGSAIRGLAQLPDKLTKEDFLEIEKVLSPVIDDENCYDICKLYRANEEYITSANNNLNGYVEANVLIIENGLDKAKRVWALQNLKRRYITITEQSFKSVFNATKKDDEEIKELAGQVLVHFLDNYKVDRATKIAVWILRQQEHSFADSIIDLCKTSTCTEIASYILSNQSEFDVSDILAVLGYIHRNPGHKMQHSTYLLLDAAIEKCSDTSERKACVEYMSSMTKRERGKDGKFYPEMLQKMYEAESDEELREEISALEKKMKL